MSGIALWFAGGDALFAGAVLIVLAADLFLLSNKYARLAARLLAIVGAILVILSATALAVWFYVLWGVAVAVLVLMPGGLVRSKARRAIPSAAAALLTLVAVALEVPWHFTPALGGEPANAVVVIGDSITAGVGVGETTWPTLLGENAGINVTDLSEPGLATASALQALEDVPAGTFRDAVVLIELGGNDMLSFGVTPREFEGNLDHLLAAVSQPGTRIVMFELPLPPFHNRFGAAQRRQAKKHRALLVPKRRFAQVLAPRENTVDGLHLSDEGQQAMAALVSEILRAGEGAN